MLYVTPVPVAAAQSTLSSVPDITVTVGVPDAVESVDTTVFGE